MKRFTKIALSFAAFFAVVGLIAIICAFAMGLTWNELIGMADNGELAIQIDDKDDKVTFFKHEEHSHHKVQNCNNLEIEFLAGSLEIYYDDVDEIEVKQEDVKNFASHMDGDTLEISGGKVSTIGGSSGTITVILPRGTSFKEVDLSIGAGEADIHDLCANDVNIEVGAGQANFIGLDVKNFDVETGTGQIDAELVGSEQDYSYSAECGVGEIAIGDTSYSGLSRETQVKNPGAGRHLDIECGIGQVTIRFQN